MTEWSEVNRYELTETWLALATHVNISFINMLSEWTHLCQITMPVERERRTRTQRKN